ncbi:MAG: valine--tRNA ligase [Bacteroidales bacterium]|jgi:valyl-tRNA synthetase|nr:valine--tRNA ligase [Bacteroidales bacterium]
MELDSKYNPANVEEKNYNFWLKNKLFKSTPDNREPYTVVIPPPNVTGVLHMGHMLNNTIQDILVRKARMQGKNACWVPGTDHASIATEAKVVAKLAEEGVKKNDITREEFLTHAWDWTHKHGGIILEQLKKLGASCDWDRTCFTMDELRTKSVIKVFCDLYEKGLIYKGVRMVNWDPKALTAISDEEVIHKEVHGKLYYIKYKIVASDPDSRCDQTGDDKSYVVVATTRPETIFGDVAVCINPHNEKTAAYKGKKVMIPFANRVIPIIEDEYVDMEFGTGFLKVTPAHDVNDYMLGEKHNLESIDIFNENGTLNAYGLQYENMDRFEARKQIEKDLEKVGLLEKVESYTNKVGFSERTDVPIEPKLSMQWFLKMESLAKPALEAIETDTIKFFPPKLKNTYRHWIENIKDWNISRQLWWGHQIPVYYLPQGGFVVAQTKEEAYQKALEKADYPLTMEDLRQDEDVLDTWFSSWLWPISVFDGINNPDNEDINYYYPTNDLVTAPEIIFFWVARMIMAGYEYRQKPCFYNVYFTGIVRDKLGHKMSKSRGNSPDPVGLMEKYGADGVRMGMLLTSPAGNDLPFDESLCEQGRNFNNKIWNAFRLVKGWQVDENIAQPECSRIAVEWFEALLNKTLTEIEDLFAKYRLSEALMMLYKLFWDEFSSWYLEMIKPTYQQPIDKKTFDFTLQFFDALLKMLHPFMPFITEELWQAIEIRKENASIMQQTMPSAKAFDHILLADFEEAKEIIAGVRSIRLQKNIPNKEALKLQVAGQYNIAFDSIITKLCHLESISTSEKKDDNAVSFLVGTTEYAVPLEHLIDTEEEIKKLDAEIAYYEKFLAAVEHKLSNEKFVANAKPEVVAMERKKQSDAKSKLRSLNENRNKLTDNK